MTNHWVDIKNADVVMVMGGNPAEAHPCGFKWVIEAKTHHKAKLIVVDEHHALVGSMNIDRSAFDLRRELGVFLTDKPAVERLIEVFERDWHRAEHWDAPDPLDSDAHEHGELPHDPDFKHE